MHIATCFDSKESSSDYSMNHKIDTSSDSAHFGIPISLHGKIPVKLLQNYCPDVLNSMNLTHQDNNIVTILPVFFHVNLLGSQNVHCHLIYLWYG